MKYLVFFLFFCHAARGQVPELTITFEIGELTFDIPISSKISFFGSQPSLSQHFIVVPSKDGGALDYDGLVRIEVHEYKMFEERFMEDIKDMKLIENTNSSVTTKCMYSDHSYNSNGVENKIHYAFIFTGENVITLLGNFDGNNIFRMDEYCDISLDEWQ
jgi:hypothetical protein